MATKNYWKRSAGWVTALKDRPLKSARVRLTALYVLQAFIILAIFVALLGYVSAYYLRADLSGQFSDPAKENALLEEVWSDTQAATGLLIIVVLIAIAILSYYSVELTLRPIRLFLESHRRFIADASHELRTPLATMRTEIEVALLDPATMSKEELVAVLESNIEEIDRMSHILTNLLNLASFNDVTGKPAMAPVDLKELIERTAERLEKYAAPKRVQIVNDLEEVKVLGNATALEEIAINLFKNAIHYSHPGGKVQITLRELNDQFGELIIRDTGVGIAPEELSHVFEPFYRSERSFHMHKTGAGLGLPLVRELIKRHNGSIKIESAAEKGTTITVHLPLASQKNEKPEAV